MTKENVFFSVEQLNNDEVMRLIKRGQAFKQGASIKPIRPLYAMNLFFESSTRTHTSFDMAERKLGLNVLNFDPSTSSVNKGETLYDTVKTIESIGIDLAVIRHSQNNYYQDLCAAGELKIGLINGGDGSGQHPSQCLLDMMTINENFDHFTGLNILISGDLTNSRVAKSNAMLLKQLGANVYFTGPKEWWSEEFTQYGQYVNFDEIVSQLDVLMLLRVQHERHEHESGFSKAAYHEAYGLTKVRYDQLPANCIIMHPAPVNRDVELASALVEAPKSRIFQQMSNGVWMRMAMIETVLQKSGLLKE